jgi:RNA polymerase sigma factor (sigma-70 family)
MGGANRDGASRGQERLKARAAEADLIREAQAGSRAAFDALVRQYEHQVLRLALHLTGSEHDAADIYQEAFLKAFRYIGNFRFECSFYTWIYRIVTNLCLDQLRRRKTRREDHAVVVDHSGDEIDLLATVSDNRSFSNPARELDRKLLGVVENMSYWTCPECGNPSYPLGRGGADSVASSLHIPVLAKIPWVFQGDVGVSGLAPEESLVRDLYRDLAHTIIQMVSTTEQRG